MTDSNQQLLAQKEKALSENLRFVEDVETVVKHLRKGVSFPVACNIINNYWGGDSTKAKQLKLQLNSTDWVENGRTILHTSIDKEDVLKIIGDRDGIHEYFVNVHAYINDRIETILQSMQRAKFTDEELSCYNEFRKEVMRYLDYINSYYYDVEPVLQKDDLTCWTQIGISTIRSDEGDYLFFDSFKEELEREQKYFIEKYVDFKEVSDYYSLSACQHFANRLTTQIKLPYLFACWLDEKVSQATV